ncbi:hypothetical protein [Aureispira anguillae]|uniref:Uncharacterized protein n=1 Tax=Aureispira anguillae TaxID=2864201 RepID=A0A915YER2_9BACT|nr:hypothetical protein [Aureispira anguillae]BDS11685.1 hypothetical protein AsAng_0023990 [Aureispira anguillae]
MMKKALLILIAVLALSENGQTQFLKEYVRSFSLKESDTILIDLQIPYEIIDWDKKIVRTFTQVESFSLPDDFLKRLARKGRYSMRGKRKDKILRVQLPEIHHAITVQGIALTDEVIAQIYVPKNFPVKVICNSKTATEQLKDLWLQQEVLTRRLKYPIRKAINSDYYADVKFQDGQIIAAKEIKGTKRFLELTVLSNGVEYRLVSRIGKLYKITELVNRMVVFVAHDFTKELRNKPNEGMLLIQENEIGDLVLITKEDIPDFLLLN